MPEVRSTHEVLGVPSVSARFGTYPQIWNIAMGTIATLVPKVGEIYACVLGLKFLDYGCKCNSGCNSEVLQFSICNMVVICVGISERSREGSNPSKVVGSISTRTRWICRGACVNASKLVMLS